MPDVLTVLALNFIQLTGPSNQTIDINPESIVALRDRREEEGHFPKGVNCIIHTNDGKFIAVIEDCEIVFLRIVGEHPRIPDP